MYMWGKIIHIMLAAHMQKVASQLQVCQSKLIWLL